jgi:hypothetical protein
VKQVFYQVGFSCYHKIKAAKPEVYVLILLLLLGKSYNAYVVQLAYKALLGNLFFCLEEIMVSM